MRLFGMAVLGLSLGVLGRLCLRSAPEESQEVIAFPGKVTNAREAPIEQKQQRARPTIEDLKTAEGFQLKLLTVLYLEDASIDEVLELVEELLYPKRNGLMLVDKAILHRGVELAPHEILAALKAGREVVAS